MNLLFYFQTPQRKIAKIISRIKEEFLDASVEAIKCSISLAKILNCPEQPLQETDQCGRRYV